MSSFRQSPSAGLHRTAAKAKGMLTSLKIKPLWEYFTRSQVLSLFSRITSSGRYLPEVDGLRFLAISMVMLLHIHNYTILSRVPPLYYGSIDGAISDLLSFGQLGVPLFFSLSGFILALPFAEYFLLDGQKPVDIRQYYIRRITRLEPPYMISMLFFFFALIAIGRDGFWDLLQHFTASIFYLHNLIYGAGSTINNNAWSLEIEIQFYMLMPLLALVFKLNSTYRTVLLSFLMIAFPIMQHSLKLSHLTIFGQAQYFIVGLLLADIFTVSQRVPVEELDKSRYGWDAIATSLFCAMPYIWKDPLLGNIAFPFLIFAFYLSVFKGNIVRRFFSYPWISAVGGMCYSIYLLHAPIISFIGRFISRDNMGTHYFPQLLLYCCIMVPATLLISSAFFLLIEKPCMRKRPLRNVLNLKDRSPLQKLGLVE